MIPEKIQPYFDIEVQKNSLIKSRIICCNVHDFEIFVTGKVQRSAFSKMYVFQENVFSINVTYEYPEIEELKELGIEEMNNAFTWIRIALECRSCKKRYNNFVDYEAD